MRTNKEDLEAGDCVIEQFGELKMEDGRRLYGMILTFPFGPPKLPIAAIWDKLPLRVSLKSEPMP